MFDRGPGGRPHGSPRPTQSDAFDRLAAKERNRKRSRAERQRAPDVSDLTGDPDTLPEDISDPDALPAEFLEAAEQQAGAYVDSVDAQMRAQGMGFEDWNTDRATAEEYMGPVAGLPDNVKHAEKERLTRPLRHLTRSDAEAYAANLQWSDDLHDDFVAAFPELAGDTEDVKMAGKRVIAKWNREGTRDVQRRIARDRDRFFDAVADEIILTPSGFERDHGGGHRTGGLDWGGRAHGGLEPERESNMTDELNADKRRTGYY